MTHEFRLETCSIRIRATYFIYRECTYIVIPVLLILFELLWEVSQSEFNSYWYYCINKQRWKARYKMSCWKIDKKKLSSFFLIGPNSFNLNSIFMGSREVISSYYETNAEIWWNMVSKNVCRIWMRQHASLIHTLL